MFPDRNNSQAQPQPGALPQVQQLPMQPAAFMQQTPVQADLAPSHELSEMVEQVKLLTQQYGANPYAFNMAFQQLKTRYLLEHYHIDPNLEKN
jgi:hypothetical protein